MRKASPKRPPPVYRRLMDGFETQRIFFLPFYQNIPVFIKKKWGHCLKNEHFCNVFFPN
ncbi:MAG: hypothetical protein RL757_3080 [Bacteroidota bacterium]|jgi:hypothetical protein